jgi:hypothetical protein
MLKLPHNNLIELPVKFPDPVVREARKMEFRDELFEDRKEVTGFTLDAADSPDLDDAIWMEPTEFGGWRILVTISDVDSLVRKDSYVNVEALSRVHSHYFPERKDNGKTIPKYVIPMLPKVLSENRLSLLEGKPRPTMSVEMEIGRDLKLISIKAFESYIKSAKRLGLREYGDRKIIGDPGLPLRDYYQMARVLNKKRWSEQSLAFQELGEGIMTDEEGMVREGSLSASSLIVQEFMVLTNFAVAQLLQEERQPTPFRNHVPVRSSPPTREQIILEIERNPDYLTLIDNIRDTYRKALGGAVYEPQASGHFGLGLPTYTHFTSPIRRYADILVHRVVKALLKGESPPYSAEDMKDLCHYINQRSRRLATLRANYEGRNSLANYRNFGHLLSREKTRGPDFVERLLNYLKINRIGNACFEFTASAGMNIEVTCQASVRYQRIRQIVSFTARADKNTVKNEAARLLLKKMRSLENESPPVLRKKSNGEFNPEHDSTTKENSPVQELYRFCEDAHYPVPTIHYEIWNGSRRPGEEHANYRCHCRISEAMTVIGTGESRLAAKIDGATKLLNYLKSNPYISRQSVLPPAREEETDETD